jgi:hypothetical protein
MRCASKKKKKNAPTVGDGFRMADATGALL